jgi:hypothetical protein
VNMMLAELAPLDVRQLFICHKEAFYRTYAGCSDEKKEHVAQYLANEYMVDKAGAREELFGHEPAMEEVERSKGAVKRKSVGRPWGDDGDDIVKRVGPWGAVRR